jgi:signal peptidase II
MQEVRGASIANVWRGRALFAGVGVAVFAVDQITKTLAFDRLDEGITFEVIGSFLTLRLSFNSGGAFGLFPRFPIFFLVASAAIVVVVAYWAWKAAAPAVGLGLIFGGGWGNLFDRLTRPPEPLYGQVVDFIQLPYWPTFNIADSAIMIGVALLLLDSLAQGRERSRDHSSPVEAS